MSRSPKVLAALTIAMTVVLGSVALAAVESDFAAASEFTVDRAATVGPCTKHARLLRRACQSDRRDDLLVHLADCRYVTAAADQPACVADAKAENADKVDECSALFDARRELCDLVGEQRFLVDFEPADFEDPDEIGTIVPPNPYWPLTAGHTHVIVGEGEVTVVTATDEIQLVGGLPCRVIRDLVFEEVDEGGGVFSYDALEVTQDWYGQHVNGDAIYCGENTYEIEDGLIDNTDGSFAHGTDRAQAGFLVRAFPVPGEGDRQEMASDEAEDYVEYVSLAASPSAAEGGEAANFPCAGACLQTFEVNPRDPGEAEHKYYLPGTGFVLATKLEDGVPTGEREEVSCIGDSIDVLTDDPDCDIGDPAALLEALCAWAPAALCLD